MVIPNALLIPRVTSQHANPIDDITEETQISLERES